MTCLLIREGATEYGPQSATRGIHGGQRARLIDIAAVPAPPAARAPTLSAHSTAAVMPDVTPAPPDEP